MHVPEGLRHLTDVSQCLGLRKTAILFQKILEGLAGDIVHHVVRSTVLLEHVRHAHDARMAQTAQRLGLVHKLPLQLLHQATFALRPHRHTRRYFIPVTEIFHEKLLNRHTLFQHHMFRLISATKSSATNETDYPIFSSLQQGIYWQIHTNQH